ncbi:putative reverse transcriptase domain-containing protein [Tanacetum coccineum]
MTYHPQTHIPLRPNLGVLQIGIKSQDIVMSDSEDSTVTYTAVSSPFGGARAGTAFTKVCSEPVYPEFMPPEDEVFPTKEQPLPAAVSPTADSPGYITDSNPEEDEEDLEEDPIDYPADGGDGDDDDDESSDDDEDDDDDVEEDKDEEEEEKREKKSQVKAQNSDPEEDEEDPIDYPADGGDDDDDDDESSDDDEDDDDDVEEDEDDDEEEEHPALADSVPPPVHRVTARMSIRDKPPTPFWSEAEIIPSPPLPVPSPVPVSPLPLPASPTYPLGFKAAMNRQRAESLCCTIHLHLSISIKDTTIGTCDNKPPLLPIPLHTPSPPLLLPSTDRRADMPEVYLPPRKRLCIALSLRYEVDESSSAPTARPTRGFRADYGFFATLNDEIRRDPERDVGYGITNTWDEVLVGMPGAPATDDIELGQRMTNFVTIVRQDINEIYGRLDDAQGDREARLPRKAWGRSMDASDTARSEVRALRTTILAQQMEIAALRAPDRPRRAQLVETLRLMRNWHCCVRMFPEESDKIEEYVRMILPDMIHRSVVASRPKTMQEAIEIETELMDKKIRHWQNLAAGSGEKKPYGGSKPLCSKCNYHHDGPGAPKCHKCNRVGHLARDYRSPGHFKRDCPKLKNNNGGNQGGNGNAPAKVYAVGRAGTNPDSNVVTGTFLLNNRYASVLFDTGADRSFVSTAFSSQIDITPSTLDHYYDVELADGRIIRLNAIIRGCTLNILKYPFNIDLMLIELGSPWT